jgi:hypothetical protein
MSSFLNNHMSVDDVEIESLVKIHFTSSSNILINSYVKIIICDEHYFKVTNIKSSSISTILDVVATETGSRTLHKQKDLDLRKLIGLSIEVITNIDEINNIERMSRMC